MTIADDFTTQTLKTVKQAQDFALNTITVVSERVSPLLGLYAAVTRQDAAGNPPAGWYPAQRMSLDEALAAFTRGAAYAEHAETERGSIAVGRAADLTMFSGTLAPGADLLRESIRLTIVGGKIVYARGPMGTIPDTNPL